MKNEKNTLFCVGLILLQVFVSLLLIGCSEKKEELTAEQYVQKGLDKYTERNYIEAIRYYDKAIEVSPNNSIAYHQRGLAKGLLNDFGGALSDLNKAIELDPNYAQAYNNRGLIKIRLKNTNGGCEDLRTAVRLGYDDANLGIKKYCN